VRLRARELLRHGRSAGAAEGGAPAARLGIELAELLAGRPAQGGRRDEDHRVRRDTRHLAALRAVTHPDLRHGAVVLETDRPAEAASADHGLLRSTPPKAALLPVGRAAPAAHAEPHPAELGLLLRPHPDRLAAVSVRERGALLHGARKLGEGRAGRYLRDGGGSAWRLPSTAWPTSIWRPISAWCGARCGSSPRRRSCPTSNATSARPATRSS